MKRSVLLISLGNIGLMYDYGLPKKFILSHARAFNTQKEFRLVEGTDIEEDPKKKF